jgi:hypothetical protein
MQGRNPMNTRGPETTGARGASGWKILVAIAFFGVALVYGLHRYARLNPPLKAEPPKAVQQDAALKRAIDVRYAGQLDALGLTPEKRKQLNRWMKTGPGQNATQEERRARAQALRAILSPEQIEQFREARKEYSEGRKAVRQRGQARMKAMLGEKEYRLHQENMKRVREEQKARKPHPSPTPSPSS